MTYEIVKANGVRLGLTKACRALGVSRSGFDAWVVRKPREADDSLVKEIHEIAKAPRYGYRRVKEALERPPYKRVVSRKKVLKIMQEHRLTVKKPVFKPRTTNSGHGFKKYPNLVKGVTPTFLNQVWAGDITYVRLNDGSFVYLASLLDLFSRKCVGWSLGRTLEAEHAIRALHMAFERRKGFDLAGLIHHSDRGVQYACDEYVRLLEERGIRISMTESGNPRENAFAESFNKTVKCEEVYLSDYESFEDALENIENFIEEVYNKKRLHSSIGYKPPDEFEAENLSMVVS